MVNDRQRKSYNIFSLDEDSNVLCHVASHHLVCPGTGCASNIEYGEIQVQVHTNCILAVVHALLAQI